MEAPVLAYNCPAQPTHLGKPFVVISVLGETLVVEHYLDRNTHQPEGFGNPPPDVSVEKQRMGRASYRPLSKSTPSKRRASSTALPGNPVVVPENVQ